MNYSLLSFDEAIRQSQGGNRHLLTGNGFSIACRSDIFTYGSLFEKADFSKLNGKIKSVFDALNTQDFEVVMRQLQGAARIFRVYLPTETDVIDQLEKDAESLKNVLVNAIASSHPEHPSELTENEYQHCKMFLNHFRNIYTLNYDLLLYWTTMHFQETKEIRADDGFRTPDSGKVDYVSWDIEKTDGQNIFYLHGALHLFDAGSELQKFTWINTGVRLIEQIRTALDSNSFPLFVSEGSSKEKADKIMHSNYLSRGLRSFAKIGGSLFIYGHSLAENDLHILKLIPKSKLQKLFVSIYGDLNSESNKRIVATAESLKAGRKSNNALEIYFYDSMSAKIWG